MTEVIVAPSAQCARTARALSRLLGRYGRVALLAGEQYLRGEGEPEFLVIGSGEIRFASSSPCILVIPNTAFCLPAVPEGSSAVLTGAVPEGCRVVGQAISCGLCAKDTLTLSSCSEQGLMLSLQRTLISLTGAAVEPMDFPFLQDASADLYEHLAAAAVLLLCDRRDRLCGA